MKKSNQSRLIANRLNGVPLLCVRQATTAFSNDAEYSDVLPMQANG